jgi:serine O-acetyltransferase
MTESREIPMPGLFACLRADLKLLCRGRDSLVHRVAAVLTNRGFHAILLYRLARAFWKAHIPLLPLILTRFAQTFYAVDIAPQASLGPGIVIVHGFGVVIGRNTRIEGDCCIFHGVTFGDRGSEWTGVQIPDGHPTVERSCMFGAGAKVLGPVTIGRNSIVGANAVVNKSVPPNSIAVGVPARVVGERAEMDENLRPIHRRENADAVSEVGAS